MSTHVAIHAYIYVVQCHVLHSYSCRSIPWANVKGYGADNCNVMLGKRNSVLSRVREKTDGRVFDLGCVCHIVNLCVGAAVKSLTLPIDDLLIDIFYFFNSRYI